jgi:Short C-terminal domain
MPGGWAPRCKPRAPSRAEPFHGLCRVDQSPLGAASDSFGSSHCGIGLTTQTEATLGGPAVDVVKNTSEAIGDLLRRMGVTSSSVAGGLAESSEPQTDPLDQLKKLAELRDSDAITPGEYEEHKRKLLAKLSRDTSK